MTIICGTDFSIPAVGAMRAAAAIAARVGETLRLVHVLDAPLDPVTGRGPYYDLAWSLLQDAAGKARELNADVAVEIVVGDAAAQLLAVAERSAASLMVVAWLGRRAPARWLVGSVAETIARACPVPVLVIRDAESIIAWARNERPLHITVADDLGSSSTGAMRWVAELARVGDSHITLAHVAWPPALRERLGVRASLDLERLQPEVEATLRSEMRARADRVGLPTSAAIEVQQGFGRPDSHLALMVDQHGSDLVVVGSHQRASLDRLWNGSVSRGVLHLASQNVASVANRPQDAKLLPTPTYRSVLVATDFSDMGNAAIPHAFALAPPGGTVHLLHVGSAGGEAQASLRLARLVPIDAAERGVEAAFHAAHGDVAEGIVATASRVSADVLCLGSRARSGLAAAVLGSVAREVVTRAGRPVLVVCLP